MKRPLILSLMFSCLTAVFLITLLFNVSAKPKIELKSCPTYENYSPQQAVKVANQLIALGETEAFSALEKFCQDSDSKEERLNDTFSGVQKTIILATLLYRNEAKAPTRRGRIGDCSILPCSAYSEKGWSHLPIDFVDDIPVLLETNCMLFGEAESALSYLNYCKENGIFRARIYWTPSGKEVSGAIEKLFSSDKWKNLSWESEGKGGCYDRSGGEKNTQSAIRNLNLINTRKESKEAKDVF